MTADKVKDYFKNRITDDDQWLLNEWLTDKMRSCIKSSFSFNIQKIYDENNIPNAKKYIVTNEYYPDKIVIYEKDI